MSDPSDLPPLLGPPPVMRPAAVPVRQGRQLVSDVSAGRRAALLDNAPDRLRARPQHHRPAPPDTRANREGLPGNPARAIRDDTRPSQLSNPSVGFLTQILGQAAGLDRPDGLQRHRDGPAMGSDAYRRAGGAPPVYPTSAIVFRLAV